MKYFPRFEANSALFGPLGFYASMQTSGLYILKNLCIFGLLAVFGIMEADSAAVSDFVEQEVCARVGLLGGLCELAGSPESEIPRA